MPTTDPLPSPPLRLASPFFATHRLARDPLSFFEAVQQKYGDFVRYRGVLNFHFVNTPQLVGFVLKHTNDLYDKQSPLYRRFAAVTGEGLLSSGGDHWKQQRRLLQPEFTPKRLARLVSQITGPTSQMLDRWEPWLRSGQTFDIASQMHNLTLQVAGRAFLDLDFEASSGAIHQWMRIFSDYVAKPPLPLVSNRRFPSLSNVRLARARHAFTRFIRKTIAHTRGRSGDDLLSRLLAAVDGGLTITESQLIDEILTLIIAGHETGSNALAWTWYFLSKHPDCGRRLLDEVDQVLGDRVPTAEDIPRLVYTKMVAEEAMRLAPPVWLITRSAIHDHRLGDVDVPAGTMVVMCPYTLHRHPELWSQPDRFDPERFAPSRAATRSRYAFVPFGAGPHVCIGGHFAMMELVVIIAMIARRTQLTLTDSRPPKLQASFTLTPANGLFVSARPRTTRTPRATSKEPYPLPKVSAS